MVETFHFHFLGSCISVFRQHLHTMLAPFISQLIFNIHEAEEGRKKSGTSWYKTWLLTGLVLHNYIKGL